MTMRSYCKNLVTGSWAMQLNGMPVCPQTSISGSIMKEMKVFSKQDKMESFIKRALVFCEKKGT